MSVYAFTLEGRMPLLMNADDVMAADALNEWRRDPRNKALSTPGDDRSPPWTWMAGLYHDGEKMVMPIENIMSALRKAAAQISMPKGRKTFKELSQAGLFIENEHCDFFSRGKPVKMADIIALKDMPFKQQFDAVKKLGFELLVKRAKPPGSQSKHVRVRAMFRHWSVQGRIEVLEPQLITHDVITDMFAIAGRTSGLGNWRPSCPQSPGSFGIFKATLTPAKAGK